VSLKPGIPQRKQPTYQMPPAYKPSIGLVGPERITGQVREINGSKVRLWDDAMDREHTVPDADMANRLAIAEMRNQPITVTTEKLRGRWQITEIE